MNRTDRLVAMVTYLQGRRVVRAEELARHFEVTVRTVYRDMAALCEGGVPVTGEAGVGYSLLKSYHLPPVMLTSEEAGALFVGGEMVRQFAGASLHEPMSAALNKLRAVLPRDRQDHVERLARHTLVMDRPGKHAPDPAAQSWLLPVQQGVVQRRVLRMAYVGRARTEEVNRDVEPLGVVFYGGAWYFVAWCRLRKDLRHFRMDRIQRLEVLSEIFPHRPDFSLTKHMQDSVAHDETIPVRVWFSRDAQGRARRESMATMVEETQRDGGAEFSLFAWSLEWVARWLLSFGDDSEAIAPAELRQLMRKQAEMVAKKYRHKRS